MKGDFFPLTLEQSPEINTFESEILRSPINLGVPYFQAEIIPAEP